MPEHFSFCWLGMLFNFSVQLMGFIHPSIHYIPFIPGQVTGGAGAYHSCLQARGGVHPARIASPSQANRQTKRQTTMPITFWVLFKLVYFLLFSRHIVVFCEEYNMPFKFYLLNVQTMSPNTVVWWLSVPRPISVLTFIIILILCFSGLLNIITDFKAGDRGGL